MIPKIKNKAKELLTWSQKYTKTDMLYLARGGFWLTSGQVISAVLSFLLAITFANLLSKDSYGTYKYILSIGGILSALTLTGMNTAVTQAVAKGFEGTLKKSFWIQLKWNILLLLSALSASIYYFTNHNQTLAVALLIIGGLYPILTSANTYGAFLSGKKDFKRLTHYGVTSSILNTSAIFIALIFTRNPLWLVLVYLLSVTITTLFFYLKTLSVFKPNDKSDSESISYGRHLSLMNILGVVANYLDRILIFHYMGPAEVAIYSIAIAPPEQIKALLKNVGYLALPKLSESSEGYRELKIVPKTLKLFWGIAAITAVYIFAAPTIFRVLFPAYVESVFLSQIFAISLVTASAIIPSSFLSAREAKKELYIFNVSSSIIQIATLFLFLNLYGLLGIILSRVVTRFINLVTISWLVKR